MEDKLKLLKDINEKFYLALSTSNIDLMEDVWLKTSDAKCVHPGWPILYGWENIKSSWEKIFKSGALADIEISKVYADVNGNSAWVNCIEKMSYVVGEQIVLTMAQTTNIFELEEDTWLMVLHHASPMPVPRSEYENVGTIQ